MPAPTRRRFLQTAALAGALPAHAAGERTAVLTFDDAVRSHRTFVAPLLAELGFGASFFVTHRWMDDRDHFMSWEEIAEIHAMGFEIGNHSWTHADFASPKNAARLEGELALVENMLDRVGVPKPVSFAWCGNRYGPEALSKLSALGYRFARRGLSPELDDHSPDAGAAFDPAVHHRLLIPTTGNAVPEWALEKFRAALAKADQGVVILQFHGVPDVAHPWVHTPPGLFRRYMDELGEQGFRVLALRDLEDRLPEQPPDDPRLRIRNRVPADGKLTRPTEQAQTRADLGRWTAAMLRHRYSADEAAAVADFTAQERGEYERLLSRRPAPRAGRIEILPYPGGRHPRIGFLDGAINPLRGTKASVFLPWDPESYVVVDLPELITSNLGHLFLAHTHVPTIWKDRNVWLENVDWTPDVDGGLRLEYELPNGIVFGAGVRPQDDEVALDLWLRNGLDETLTGLRTQLCVMLKGAPEFNDQTRDNKILEPPVAAVRSRAGDRWILTAWKRTGRSWGNPQCPCMHADPVFADCPPGATVRLEGRLFFHEGAEPEAAVESARRWAEA